MEQIRQNTTKNETFVIYEKPTFILLDGQYAHNLNIITLNESLHINSSKSTLEG